MTPCGMYMKASRTGGLAAFFSAQPMVSSRGSASAAPNPRRTVRRSISRLFRIRRPLQFVDAAMGERIAGNDGDHQRLQTVAVLRDRGGQLIGDDLVVALQLAAQRVGQQTAGQVAREVVQATGDDPFQLPGRAELEVSRELPGRVDRAPRLIPVAPASDRVEVLQAEADRIQDLV